MRAIRRMISAVMKTDVSVYSSLRPKLLGSATSLRVISGIGWDEYLEAEEVVAFKVISSTDNVYTVSSQVAYENHISWCEMLRSTYDISDDTYMMAVCSIWIK